MVIISTNNELRLSSTGNRSRPRDRIGAKMSTDNALDSQVDSTRDTQEFIDRSLQHAIGEDHSFRSGGSVIMQSRYAIVAPRALLPVFSWRMQNADPMTLLAHRGTRHTYPMLEPFYAAEGRRRRELFTHR